jgi:DNA-binding GntR family transcriptional regulator
MTTLVRVKTSDAVAAHLLDELFTGRLRTGDRIDLDEVARELGVSRAPVREGLMQLERDGLVHLPHYRGAYVEAFDAGTVREAFELYGLLSAVTNRRVAAARDAGVLAELSTLDGALAGAGQVDEYERLAREFRRVVNVAAAGNHLRALLRSFSGLVPAAARFSIEDDLPGERAALHREFEALRDGDPAAAATAAVDHILLTAGNAVAALCRRGVFPAGTSPSPHRASGGREELLSILSLEGGGR